MASRNTEKPNILFILTDDQGPWAMGCAGNPEVRTPNLDRLAAEGIRFDNCFCTSPVCSPARASILTGRIPSQHGVHDFLHRVPAVDENRFLEGQPTYIEALSEAGYETGFSGKWHLGYGLEPQAGFKEWIPMPYGGCAYYHPPIMVGNKKVVVHDGSYATDIFTDNALKILNNQLDNDNPFCVHLHFTAPHRPWEREHHPKDLWDDYNKNCPFESVPTHDEPKPRGYRMIQGWRNDEHRREGVAGYFTAIQEMDRNVGRVIDWLDKNNLRQNTLVVFMSDNGMNIGHHGFFGKGNGTWPTNMYENSVKVPFIISRPGFVPENRVNTNMVSQYDWLPTILEYTGLADQVPQGLPGHSFSPILHGKEIGERENIVVFDEYGPVRMIRSKEWKLVLRYQEGFNELFHLTEDPDEKINLFHRGHDDKVDSMRREMEEWFSRYADPRIDGVKLPITGLGQRDRADAKDAFPLNFNY